MSNLGASQALIGAAVHRLSTSTRPALDADGVTSEERDVSVVRISGRDCPNLPATARKIIGGLVGAIPDPEDDDAVEGRPVRTINNP